MPDGRQSLPTLAGVRGAQNASTRLVARHDRPPLQAFVADAATERAVADGASDFVPGQVDIRRGGIRAAINVMRTAVTPSILIVDIAGEENPIAALAEFAQVVEPDAYVLVLGDIDSVDFYREITRGLGANDYLPKPLTADKIARHFGTIAAGYAPADSTHGGTLVTVTGVRGGVGATTIAVNLAGHFGTAMRRHTVLFDPDLQFGDASFLLNVSPGPGLRMALETPERVDALLAERAAQPAAERLHVLAGEDQPGQPLSYSPGSVQHLVAALRRRYNFVVADTPFRPDPLIADLLLEPHRRVLVMLPTLACVRATLRMMHGAPNAERTRRPCIVLNRIGISGGMTRREFEDALAVKVDVAIPDEPKKIIGAAVLGELAVNGRNGMRAGIVELARHVAEIGMPRAPAEAAPASRRRFGVFRR